MISGLLETRLPNENLQKDLSGHTVPKPKPAQRIKGVSTGSGRDPKILITTVLISAYIWFSISHISIIFEETDVTACRCQPATTIARGPEGNSCIQCSSGSEMTQVPPAEGGHILMGFEMLSVAHFPVFVFSLANMEIRIQGWFCLINYLFKQLSWILISIL